MELARKTLKSVIATTQHPIEVKIKKKSTELSKYNCELKDNNIQHNLKWRIASKAHPCMRKWKVWFMLNGKINHHKSRSLNTTKHTRYELVSKCRHMNKFTLRRFKKKLIDNSLIVYFKALLRICSYKYFL